MGAGPVGLSLALALARHGVRSVLVERKAGTSERSKAPGIHIRTREAFRLWGVEERFLEAGTLKRTFAFHSPDPGRRPLVSIDFSELEEEADRPGILILEQGRTERLLLDCVREAGSCDVRFRAEAVGLEAGREGARLTVRENGTERVIDAEFVAGCDGASSFVRRSLGLAFEGMTYSIWPILADVRITDERDGLAWPRGWNGPGAFAFALRLETGLWRVVQLQRRRPKSEEVPDEDVTALTEELLGPGPTEVVWSSRFRIHLRSAPRFRAGRVLLAGDAAHIHSPAGGQGMNAGIQDAQNLGWKLAAALRGGDVERLLDSYDVERRAVAVQSVSRYADFITRAFVQTPAVLRRGAFALARGALRVAAIRRRVLRRATMIDLDYPESPLLDGRERAAGMRLPNPLLRAPDGRRLRLYDVLPAGVAILEVADDGLPDLFSELPVEAVLRIGAGGHEERGGALRSLLGGEDGWILVRPDAHVAWARTRAAGSAEATRLALGAPPPGAHSTPRSP